MAQDGELRRAHCPSCGRFLCEHNGVERLRVRVKCRRCKALIEIDRDCSTRIFEPAPGGNLTVEHG